MEPRKSTQDFDQELLHLYDQYVHGGIDRRGFIDRAAKFAVGSVTAAMLLDQLSPDFAYGQQVKADDGRLKTEGVSYSSPNGNSKTSGYLERPANGTGKRGVSGTEPQAESAHRRHARRLALDNFMAFAPDALAPLGAIRDEDSTRALPQLDQAKTRETSAAAAWLNRPDCTGDWHRRLLLRRRVNMLALKLRTKARRYVHGNQPSAEDTAKIKSPMLIHCGERSDHDARRVRGRAEGRASIPVYTYGARSTA